MYKYNGKILKTKEDITTWLEEYQVKDYELIPDETYGHVVNVSGAVDLSYQQLIHISVKFAHVGDFYCDHNQLTSLDFCPTHVDRDFYCDHNQLTSLDFCPTRIGGDFCCDHNQLTSLEFCPVHVGGRFYCGQNYLLQNIQNITKFNEIYQFHQVTKIMLIKERLMQKLSDESMISFPSQSKMKI